VKHMDRSRKGSYILLLELPEPKTIMVGKQGEIKFENGYYAYVGSALNGLKARISRHLRAEKRLFWHIDYLTKYAKIRDIFYNPTQKKDECKLAHLLASEFSAIKNFGSGDCGCQSHLFYTDDYLKLHDKIIKAKIKKANNSIFP
jgi:Uri superfamily endonuclease